MFFVVAKITAEIILERITEYIESLINGEKARFPSGSSCIDYIYTLRIILEQCVGFGSPLQLAIKDFKKAFGSVSRYCIWRALRREGGSPPWLYRHYFFPLLVTFLILPCPDDMEGYDRPSHLSSNTPNTLMISICLGKYLWI